MQLFYAPCIKGKYATLSKTESNHCIHVLRHARSDIVHLMDGEGGLYKAIIIDPDPHACQVEIIESIPFHENSSCRLHLAIAPPKQADRFEWMLEKAVEIGIYEITPLWCQRSERKEINPERLDKIVIAAMKQALVIRKPSLHGMMAFPQFIRTALPAKTDRFIAWCGDSANKPLQNALVKGNDAVLLIGPEGDFTSEEIRLAIASGYSAVSLGPRRLRTETAALAGCVVFNTINT
jgi:16S rRNA (uracil1498-N3)-methyltransferase